MSVSEAFCCHYQFTKISTTQSSERLRLFLVLELNLLLAAAAAKSLQSCPTLCNPIDGSPPGSPIPEILQARILEWVAISFSNAWKWKVKAKSLSHIRLLATPRTATYQAPPSMGFPGKSTGVGCHCLLQSSPLETTNPVEHCKFSSIILGDCPDPKIRCKLSSWGLS